jgi:hypothetical protein
VEKLRSISKKHNWLIVILGIILGAFVILSSTTEHKPAPKADCDATEQAPATVSETGMEAVQSTSQAPVERTSYLIEVLLSFNKTKAEEAPRETFLPSPTKVFKVLFRHIISPNSP